MSMSAVAQGSAGIALVMCFGLLGTSQVGVAAILLAVQSVAAAITAVALHQPLTAAPPLILSAGFWLLRRAGPSLPARSTPIGGPRLSIGAGVVLAMLCQSQGSLAVPLAVVLLSILLAATRTHRLMQLAALIVAQNAIALAGSLGHNADLLLPAACLILPLPLAAGLVLPAIPPSPLRDRSGRPRRSLHAAAPWVDIGLALAILAATLIVPLNLPATIGPLDPLAAGFAPLLGLDGLLRACARKRRTALTPVRRGAALLQSGFTILAVSAPDPVMAWLAVLAAMAMALLPAMSRHWSSAVLAMLGAGLALLGLSLPPAAPSAIGCFALFAGFATIAAVVPDLAAVLVILILRASTLAPWPPGVEALGSGISTLALLACATLLTNPARPHRTTLLVLGQASIAGLAVSTGQAEAHFAALVLLILLVLCQSAARVAPARGAALATASLAGVPPFGVFPGLVLVVLALSADEPWLLLPLGAGLIPLMLAAVPRRVPDRWPAMRLPPLAWLPLLLAAAAGYFAPNDMVHWWRLLTAGPT